MTDRPGPSQNSSHRTFTAGIVGFAYLAFADAAMAAWIMFLIWAAKRILAKL